MLKERSKDASSQLPNSLLANLRLVTDSLASIKELEVSEYQTLIQNIGIGIVKQDKDGRVIVANNAALKMLDITKEQMMGTTSLDPNWNVIHEDGSDYPGNTHPAYIVKTTFKPVHNAVMGVYRPNTKDRVWLLVNAEPQFDAYENFLNVIVTFTNISEYKKVQDELKVKNNILHSIDEFSLDIMSVMDEHGNHVYVSKSATTISGYTNDELLQMNATELVPEKNKTLMQEVLNTLRVAGQLKNVRSKLVCKDGSIKYISWSLRWDNATRVIYVNGRDKTLQIQNAKEAEAKRIADELQIRDAIFEEEEQKRNSIGYELHENVGQIIATVKMYLDRYEKNGLKEILQESKDLLSVCIDELRTITYVNSIPKFSDVGFTNAIEILMQLQLKKLTVVHSLNMAVDEAIISDVDRINIYRLIQLWLSNIATKAELASVLVDIIADGDLLKIQIIDEVVQVVTVADDVTASLMPIKERLNIIGGTMDTLASADGKCFTLTIALKRELV